MLDENEKVLEMELKPKIKAKLGDDVYEMYAERTHDIGTEVGQKVKVFPH